MTFSLPGRLRERFRSLSEERRASLMGGLFLTGLLISLGYHVAVEGEPTATLYHMVVLIGFAALWPVVDFATRRWADSAVGVFWTTALACMLLLGIGGLGLVIFEDGGALYTHLFAVLSVGFIFVLLQRLRRLVLFRRTRRSLRNWRWMLALMAAAALTAFGKPPESSLGVAQALFLVPAVILMVVNAFRLSWIVHLSFREKMMCIGLSLLLIVLLGISLGRALPVATVLRQYSYPLFSFAEGALTFGILYSTAALLSLLFHLPTTNAFQRKADEIAAMGALTHLVGQAFDRDKLHASIAASAVEAGSAQTAWLMRPGEAPGEAPRIVATHDVTKDRVERSTNAAVIYEDVCRNQMPLHLSDAPADARIHAAADEGFGSLLAVPLLARDKTLGVLFAAKDVTHGFEADDVDAVRMFAAQAALALDHARLFEEQLEKERIERELHIARTVQQRLLPTRAPHVPGLALAASSTSAQEVGGDYYDFVELEGDRLAFIVADVSGKGTSAAFYMAELQGIFQSAARLAPAPADFLCHANRTLGRKLEKHVFISALYGLIDPHEEQLTFARAGHCPAAAIDLHGEARLLRPRGLGLGLNRGPLFRKMLTEEHLKLRPGDAFAFYTDGLVESRNADDEEYGYERLLAALREHRYEEASALHAALLRDLRAFTARDAYDDDTTLVVCKWEGVPVPTPSQAPPHDSASQTATLDLQP